MIFRQMQNILRSNQGRITKYTGQTPQLNTHLPDPQRRQKTELSTHSTPNAMSTMAPTLAHLEGMSDEEIVAMYDALAKDTVVGTQQYLDEHRHRKHLRISQTMGKHTKAIHCYTVIILIAKLVNLVVAFL